MSNFGGVWIGVLEDAIDAGRSVLRDLDARDIPASLQRVASYSGGKLPPPFAVSLLAEIDGNDWFREKVSEQWAEDPDSPGALFLRRPDGWWLELSDVAAAAGSSLGEDQVADLEKRLEKSEAKLRAATTKLAEQRKELETVKRRSREIVESTRQSLTSRFEAERAELAAASARAASLTDQIAVMESEHQELQEAFANVRARLAKARRFRVEESPSGGGARSLPSNPVQLARLLDLQTASFGRAPAADTPSEETAPATRLTLGSGVRPDSADGIRWLLQLAEPVVVLVDGYNAQFHIDRSDFTSGAARRTLVGALRRMREAAAVRHRIVIVFDSTLPGERLPRSSLGGVEVRFTERDVIADEEIVEMVEDLDRVVVISSDREVREGAEANGAVVLWSEALAEWLARL